MFVIFLDLIIGVLVVILYVMNAKGGKNETLWNNKYKYGIEQKIE